MLLNNSNADGVLAYDQLQDSPASRGICFNSEEMSLCCLIPFYSF